MISSTNTLNVPQYIPFIKIFNNKFYQSSFSKDILPLNNFATVIFMFVLFSYGFFEKFDKI